MPATRTSAAYHYVRLATGQRLRCTCTDTRHEEIDRLTCGGVIRVSR